MALCACDLAVEIFCKCSINHNTGYYLDKYYFADGFRHSYSCHNEEIAYTYKQTVLQRAVCFI